LRIIYVFFGVYSCCILKARRDTTKLHQSGYRLQQDCRKINKINKQIADDCKQD